MIASLNPRERRVRIVATLGPVSRTPDMIDRLVIAGADTFRVNMSHGEHAAHAELFQHIRAAEGRFGRPMTILVDLQGPKLRVGTFAQGKATLTVGQRFTLDAEAVPGNETRVALPHPEIFAALRPGACLLLDDGKLRLRVVSVRSDRIETDVEIGGVLSNAKGVNVPDVVVPIPALTAKDRRDLDFALDHDIDWVALSFVQRPDDVAEARRLIGGKAAILAKIEKPAAVERLTEILDLADAVMVARGDLGVELPPAEVPPIQKRIVQIARRAGKPVVVATQMLESMITAPVPTRAEVSDVATAVFEGADAVMLSAESAAGQYPVEAVATMNRIGIQVEGDDNFRAIISAQRTEPEATGADALAFAARNIAETVDIKTIVAWTSSGSTGLRIARERPQTPVMALTPNVATARRLAVSWGIHAVVTEDAHDVNDMTERAAGLACAEGFAAANERVLIVAGVPFGSPGATNLLRLAFVNAAGSGSA